MMVTYSYLGHLECLSRPGQRPDWLWVTKRPMRWIPSVVSLVVNWQGHEADDSPPSTAEVENGGVILSLPHVSSWDIFTFCYFRVMVRLVPCVPYP
jgi:1-acyl-sn-glycerol-3-phosphate acyltransferase